MASGRASQHSALFSVALQHFETPDLSAGAVSSSEPALPRYRGLTGSIQAPSEIADPMVGVFGFDSRPIGGRNGNGDPTTTNTTTVPKVVQRYNFPNNSAAGQTIAIFAQQLTNGSGVVTN
jgi:kumamolisin